MSIGIVEVTPERFKNSLEIGEAGAAVKHLAKTIFGSSYVVDRRKNRDETFDKIKGNEDDMPIFGKLELIFFPSLFIFNGIFVAIIKIFNLPEDD